MRDILHRSLQRIRTETETISTLTRKLLIIEKCDKLTDDAEWPADKLDAS